MTTAESRAMIWPVKILKAPSPHPPVALAAYLSKVVALSLLIQCFKLSPLFMGLFVFEPYVYCVVFSVLSNFASISLGKRTDCFTLIGFLDVMWLLVLCVFSSWCPWLVCRL